MHEGGPWGGFLGLEHRDHQNPGERIVEESEQRAGVWDALIVLDITLALLILAFWLII